MTHVWKGGGVREDAFDRYFTDALTVDSSTVVYTVIVMELSTVISS